MMVDITDLMVAEHSRSAQGRVHFIKAGFYYASYLGILSFSVVAQSLVN